MGNNDQYNFDEQTAERIVAATRAYESNNELTTDPSGEGSKASDTYNIKIVEDLGDGKYKGDEAIQDGDSWILRAHGIQFGYSALTGAVRPEAIREINEIEDIPVGTIVQVTSRGDKAGNTQWYFEHGIQGATGTTELDHPFKARIKPGYSATIEVGFLRPVFKDIITIYDAEDGGNAFNSTIDFGAAADDIVISESSYVFYRIHKVLSGGWIATLEADATYIPSDEENSDRFFLIGYAVWDTSSISEWYQHAFECPEFHQFKPQNHAFEGLPIKNVAVNSYRFSSGTISACGEILTTTDAQVLPDVADDEVYFIVKLKFDADAFPAFSSPVASLITEGDVASNDLISGTMGSQEEWKSINELWLRFRVGLWDANENWKQDMISDIVLLPSVYFNDAFTDEFHPSAQQIPRMIGGTGKVLQGSNVEIDDNGELTVYDPNEAAAPRQYLGFSHDGTDGILHNPKGILYYLDPDDLIDVEVSVKGSTDKKARYSLRTAFAGEYFMMEHDTDTELNTLNDTGTAGFLLIQSKSKADVKIFSKVDSVLDNRRLNLYFHPGSEARNFLIQSVADAELNMGGQVAGVDFNKIYLERMSLKVRGGGHALLLEMLDSGGVERLSTTKEGKTKINDSWYLDKDAPTASGQVLKAVAGDLTNPKWELPDAPSSTTIEVITDMQLDSSNNLQIKTTVITVLAKATESAWTTVTDWSVDVCP